LHDGLLVLVAERLAFALSIGRAPREALGDLDGLAVWVTDGLAIVVRQVRRDAIRPPQARLDAAKQRAIGGPTMAVNRGALAFSTVRILE
jgi:hypothetical protein